MQHYFEGKKVLITGASSGIGKALAIALSKFNTELVLASRNTNALEQVAAQCHSKAQVTVAELDLSARANHQAFVHKFEGFDLVFHNAGISQRSLVAETIFDVDHKLMEVNYLGTVHLTKLLLPAMLQQGGGHFIVVTSLTGLIPTPYRSSYAASKHALHGFFDSMRAELESQGIHITLAAPGFVQTNVSVNALIGDGSVLGKMDDAQANGITAEHCADQILKATAKKKRLQLIGRESYAVWVRRFFPSLFARLIKKAKVR